MYNVYIVEGEEDRVVYFDNTVFLFCRFRSGMSHSERSVNIYDTVYCGKHSLHWRVMAAQAKPRWRKRCCLRPVQQIDWERY